MLPDLQATPDDTVETIAAEIAGHMSEPKTELIGRVFTFFVIHVAVIDNLT